jgi:hypothetical protein
MQKGVLVMNNDIILFFVFFISCFAGALLVRLIETLIKRYKAHKRYLRRIETENQRLKRTVSFMALELRKREVIICVNSVN